MTVEPTEDAVTKNDNYNIASGKGDSVEQLAFPVNDDQASTPNNSDGMFQVLAETFILHKPTHKVWNIGRAFAQVLHAESVLGKH